MIEDFDEAEDTGLPDNKPFLEKEEDLIAIIRRKRKLADQAQSQWRKDARADFAFLAGHQWDSEETAALEEMKRLAVVFNRIEPTIESIAGHEGNNRTAGKYLPRGVAVDAPVAELLSNAADWVRDQCDAEDEESDAFVDMLSCGIGASETTLDYDTNPDGEITISRVDPLSLRWDPAARKRNLVDCTWVQRDKRMTLAEIISDWPEAKDRLGAKAVAETDTDQFEDEDGEPHNASKAHEYTNDQSDENVSKNYRTVICHEWYENRPYMRVLDPMTQQVQDLEMEEFERVQQAAQAGLVAPPTQAVQLKKRVYKQAFMCEGVLLEERESITQKGFTINFITGRRDRNRNSWYGVVRPMRDPQKFANKYLSLMEALVRGGQKGGLMVEDGATDNPKKLEDDWAKQDSVIYVNDGALSQGKIQPKPPVVFPPGPEKLLEFSISSIRDVTGVNLEALGLADRNQPGILEMQRRESALTILAPLFNSLRRYRKVQGRVLADLIIRYINDGRLIRVVQGDGTEQFVPLMRLPETMEYDVVVDSSSNAPDQKARTFAIMSQLIPALEKSGFPTPPEILDYVPLPQSLIQKWKVAVQGKMNAPPPKPPEVIKAEIMANVEMFKAKEAGELKKYIAGIEANTKTYIAALNATQEAQAEQLRAAINEQSQIINAQANEQKSLASMVEARLNGLSKLIDATSKVRDRAQKQIEQASSSKAPNVVAFPMPAGDNGMGEMQAQALQQMADAVGQLTMALSRPKTVVRGPTGDIVGVQ